MRLSKLPFSALIVAAVLAAPVWAADATIRSDTLTLLTNDYFANLQARGDCYAPYHNYPGGAAANRVWETVILENDYVQVVVAPELGGRVLRFVNKTTGSNQYYDNPMGVKRNGWGRLGWWMATGGTEIMMPWDEHGGCFYTPFDDHPDPSPGKGYKMEDLVDGVQLTLVYSEGSYLSLTRWDLVVELFLPDDRAYYTVTKTVENKAGAAEWLSLWQNTMISPGPGNMNVRVGQQANLNQKIVFDQNVTSVYNHNDNLGESFWGDPWDVVNWPVHTGPLHNGSTRTIDISLIQNWYTFGLQFAGLFTRDGMPSTYFGQYNLDADEGVMIVLPQTITQGVQTGVKYWHWGSFSGSASPSFADGNTTYCELMTGPVRVFQEPAVCQATTHPTGEPYRISVNPGEPITWTEHYLTPQGIGSMVKGTADVVLNLQVPAGAKAGSPVAVQLGAYTTANQSGCSVALSSGGVVFYEETGLDIGPGTAPGPYFRDISPILAIEGPGTEINLTFTFPDQSSVSVTQPIDIARQVLPALFQLR